MYIRYLRSDNRPKTHKACIMQRSLSVSIGLKQITYHTGVIEPAWGLVLAGLKTKGLTVCIARDAKSLERWAEGYQVFHRLQGNDKAPLIFNYPLPPQTDWDLKALDQSGERLRTLEALRTLKADTPITLFTTLGALNTPAPSPEALQQASIVLITQETYPFKALAERFAQDLNYDAEALCESPGQYAIRGGLIDVYPLGATEPYRLDFFGDTLESIRPFNPTTQRTLPEKTLPTLTLQSAKLTENETSTLLDHLPKAITWVLAEPLSFDDKDHVLESLWIIRKPFATDTWVTLGLSEALPDSLSENNERVQWNTEALAPYRMLPPENLIGFDRLSAEEASRDRFLSTLQAFQDKGETLLCLSATEGDVARLKESLALHPKLKMQHAVIELAAGFRLFWEKSPPASLKGMSLPKDSRGLIVITEAELFRRHRLHSRPFAERKVAQRSAMQAHLDFEALVEGDLLVHLQHGVCRFHGFASLGDSQEKVLTLEFQDGVRLHVPIHETHLLSRYVGVAKSAPKLGKIGSKSWAKAKEAAEAGTKDFAAQLLRLHALRDMEKGHAFPLDHPWQKEIEASFPFTDTPDQSTAIQAIKEDMQRPRPMDRLLCGDVGFGKTEVALRAAFKAVMGGKQVAVLVPTTLLCEQHFRTFKERMVEYPVVVEMLSRFRTPKERSRILAETALGKIDILIGTHALLSESLVYKDLGLLIIDEEHRFGVAHKETLKRMRAMVDVLAMSATPIPRTLYMALVGARDLSLLETPPQNRLPIETTVKPYDKETVRTAILAELERGGQTFYLHNRVSTIQNVAKRLQALVPQARIAIGHGQMPAEALEEIMTRFVAGEYDILIATTIIESGIDIPNANTLIVEGADRFGLAQLYQLRGRVGRFDRQAFAYFFLSLQESPAGDAYKRLDALRKHNQLGAGFRIAMRDLELRGAGNLLGAEQSGHIATVGFDLYCQLLKISVSKMKGEKVTRLERAQVRLDFAPLGEAQAPVDSLIACIPESYMPELRQRMDYYRQFSLVETQAGLENLLENLKDRYGAFPRSLKALIHLAKIRLLAESRGFISIEAQGERLLCKGAKGYWKIGPHFPRLTKKDPWLRLAEIEQYIKQNPKLS